jgi:ankyrin repeat protein
MDFIGTEEPLAVDAVAAIRTGDLPKLQRLLERNPTLATARLGTDGADGMSRTLLHVVTDWPGHYPNGSATVALLIAAGADVNARFAGPHTETPHTETPLHWAASSDDVDVLDALLDAGADIEAPGAVIRGGSPLRDATAFGQWRVARWLVERGAHVTSFDAAALGLMDRLRDFVDRARPDAGQVSDAFWAACHGGQSTAAGYLLDRGAELNWIPGWEELSPLDAAARSGATELVKWLHSQGAKTATDLRGHCAELGVDLDTLAADD